MSNPKAFDPARDPFDPTQERWAGWERNMGTRVLLSIGGDYDAVVLPGSGARFSRTGIEVAWAHERLYDAAFIPHATVVSILVSNGYKPEVMP